jgi:serine phosphatase RsbU (regulator of sigma subunit)
MNVSLGIVARATPEEPIPFAPLPLTNPDGTPNLTNAACWAVHRREMLHIPDIRQQGDFDFSGPRRFDDANKYFTLSILTVPIEGWDGEVVAVLQMINAKDKETSMPTSFSSEIQHGVKSLAALTAGALESFETKRRLYRQQQLYLESLVSTQKRLRKELAEAESYVRAILPAPQDAPLKIDWHLAPCSELGGDSFGYHEIDADHWALYILDVCGHGLSAALLSVTVAKMLRSGALPDVDFTDPGRVLSVLNNAFLMRDQNNFYFTIWYGVFEISTRTIRYASAGHAPAILVDGKTNAITKLHAPGMVLGAREDKVYASHAVTAPEGSTLYLLSDGTYEVTQAGGVMWPFDAFLETLAALPHAEEGALTTLHEAVLRLRHPEPLEDDFSVVRVRT